jgi:FMN phosphatase YigB (HAD superfamily)
MIKAVTLDYWNTLFVDHAGRERERRRAECLRAELAALGQTLSDATLVDALETGYLYFERVWRDERRTPDATETVDAILDSLGARAPQESRVRIVDAFELLLLDFPPEPVAGAQETLRVLSDRYRLAVISDTGYSPGHVLRKILQRYDMLAPFDYLYFSDEGGVSKPDRRVFAQVLDELGVRGPEAVHVGDMQRTDIAGAQAAGMWAILFLGANANDAAHSTADAVVRRFDELPGALGNLAAPAVHRRHAGPPAR